MGTFASVADRIWTAEALDPVHRATVVAGQDTAALIGSAGDLAYLSDTVASAAELAGVPIGYLILVEGSPAVLDLTDLPAVVVVLVHESQTLAGTPSEQYDRVRTLSSVAALDLGERTVEVIHPGAAATPSSLMVRVGDADVLVVGELIHGPGQSQITPAYGPVSDPLQWPVSLDLALALTTSASTILAATGAATDREFAEEQRAAIGIVAETIRDLHTRSVPLEQALAAADWPYPAADLGDAVARGYAVLPTVRRQLPLL